MNVSTRPKMSARTHTAPQQQTAETKKKKREFFIKLSRTKRHREGRKKARGSSDKE